VEKESDVMSRPALHGERLLLDRPSFEWLTMATIKDDEWKEFEKVIDHPISDEIRDRIKFHLDCSPSSSLRQIEELHEGRISGSS
jgi:hypothetical protein